MACSMAARTEKFKSIPIFCNEFLWAGAVAALTKCVTPEALERAVLDRVPKGTEDANKKALAAGYSLAEKAAN